MKPLKRGFKIIFIIGLLIICVISIFFIINSNDSFHHNFDPLKYLHEKYNIDYSDMELFKEGYRDVGLIYPSTDYNTKRAEIKINSLFNGDGLISVSYSKFEGWNDNYKEELAFSEKNKSRLTIFEQYLNSYVENYKIILRRYKSYSIFSIILDIRNLDAESINKLINKFNTDVEIYMTSNFDYFNMMKDYDDKNKLSPILDFFKEEEFYLLNESYSGFDIDMFNNYSTNSKIIYRYSSETGYFEVYEKNDNIR